MEQTLRDAHDSVRSVVARELGRIKDAAAVPGLIAAYRRETNDEVRRSILEALGRLHNALKAKRAAAAATEEEIASLLREARRCDESKVVRFQAVMGLYDPDAEPEAAAPVLVGVPASKLPALSIEDWEDLKHLLLAYRIRVICRQKGKETNNFSAPSMVTKLKDTYGMDISKSNLNIYLADVDEFFANHLKIKRFSLFDKGPKVGYAFVPSLHPHDEIERAWAIIEQWGQLLDPLFGR
jgi:hypothetical protein